MKKAILCIIFAAILLASAPAMAMSPNGSSDYSIADISHNDTITSWPGIKSSTDGLYIKATEGVTYTDPQYKAFTKAAKLQDIPLGFYHFFWPWSGSNGPYKARQQADSFWRAIKGNSMQLIPVVDVEETNGCSAAEITAGVQAFCDELVRVDGAPGVMVYCSPSFANDYLSGLSKYPLWVANYGVSSPRSASDWPNWTMWQYTETGSLPGISGYVDLNKATANAYLYAIPAVPAVSTSVSEESVYPVNSLPYAINSRAGANFDVLDSSGNKVYGRSIDKGDPLIILSVNYSAQLAEVLYPSYSQGQWIHAYIHNREDLLHNVGYNKWQNGSTNEAVYDASGNRIGTIYPNEKATKLYKQNGKTAVLYTTAKGAETKSGFVAFAGK